MNDTDGLIHNKFQNVVETIKNFEFKINGKTGNIVVIVVIASIAIVLYESYLNTNKSSKRKTKRRKKK